MGKTVIDSPEQARGFVLGVLEDLVKEPVKLHKDYQEVDSMYFASFLVFLGYKLVRVQTDLSGRAMFGLFVPQGEFDEAEAAWSDDSIMIENPQKLCQALALVWGWIKRSKQNGGSWSNKIV
jgi:hypothetical protein